MTDSKEDLRRRLDAIRRRASPLVQLGAFVVALAAVVAATVGNAVTRNWLEVDLVPIPVIIVAVACLITVYTRSLWPAVALVALAVGFDAYAIAVNLSTHMTVSEDIAVRVEFAASLRQTAELGVGALAGWLWCQRESRLAVT